MKFLFQRLMPVLLIMVITGITHAQTVTRTAELKAAAAREAEKERRMQEMLPALAKQKGWDLVIRGPKGKIGYLVGVDALGYPEYIITDNNIAAAATIGTSRLWPGGSTGLNLSGSSNNVKNKLAIWDGGRIRVSHIELSGRVVQRDAPASFSDHATHVAGTLVAAGVNPLAKGMSFGQQELIAYDFGNDNSEMLTEASGLLLSNHSYGEIAGWHYNDAQSRWEFRGRFDETEDYKMGYYNSKAELWDSIAYNAPYYLIVKSAGNKRNENGPAEGENYWRFDAGGSLFNAGPRPPGIYSNNSYDIIPSYGTAKNILTIGAVNTIPLGYTKPSDVQISSFSSWGPTDDGRIKPDVVAAGVGILSTTAASDNSYDSYGGTSMSSPNASGSLLLLQEYYAQLHENNFMRSATLKGLVIHTADEAGLSPGPDYQHGWGLINVKKAADVITGDNEPVVANKKHRIQEAVLNNTNTFTQNVIATGNGPLVATISWTDPKGTVEPSSNPTALNNPAKKLVHDLDIVIKRGATTYQPWVLNPASPSAAATRGNNNTDNVEQVLVSDVIPGETYTIEITHKGTLERGLQAYSLISSGVGGKTYCSATPSATAGARIDSVSFANIRNQNAAGCTGYSNFTNLTASVQPGQTLPFFARLNSCDASVADKAVKIFIDGNNDGDFDDAGELLATSSILNGNADFTTNITIPVSLAVGNATILRVVMQETSSADAVNACGAFTRGETQDYRVVIAAPSVDAGIAALVSPATGDCKSAEQFATVIIRNYGTSNVNNVPVAVEVKQGTTTVVNLSATFNGIIPAGADVEFTFQTPFALLANTSYTVTASTNVTGDQVPGNNTLVSNITTAPNPTAPTGLANVCGTTVNLTATSGTSQMFNWYTSPTATPALASGSSTTTTTILDKYYLSTGEIASKLGAANKMVFTDGGYNQFSPGIRFTAFAPTILKTARLYIGHSGKVTFHLRELVSYNETNGSYNYFPVSSKTLDVIATAPVPPTLGEQNNSPADLGAIYNLGIIIPEAKEYILAIEFADGASVFRNNNIIANHYPYTIQNLISMTGNTAFQAGNPTYPQGFYYYLYNIDAKPVAGCASERTEIVTTTSVAPVISNTGNQFSSNFVDGNQWYLNNNPIPGATGQTHTAVASGTYKVIRADGTGCLLSSNEITFTVTAVTDIGGGEIGLSIAPNPSDGRFILQLETRTKSDMVISLINSLGQEVFSMTEAGQIGKFNKEIHAGKLSPGVYYVKVQHDRKVYSKKLVIVR